MNLRPLFQCNATNDFLKRFRSLLLWALRRQLHVQQGKMITGGQLTEITPSQLNQVFDALTQSSNMMLTIDNGLLSVFIKPPEEE